MKTKILLPLILLAGMTLVGCGGNNPGPEPEPPAPEPVVGTVTINKDSANISVEAGHTYPTAATNFTVNGVTLTANKDVGIFNAVTDEGAINGYVDLKTMQFRTGQGVIFNTSPHQATSVTFNLVSTYNTQQVSGFPVVKAGAAADALTAVDANETSTQTGTSTGKKQYSGGQNRDVYSFAIHYTLPAGTLYYSLGGSASYTSYVTSIVVA